MTAAIAQAPKASKKTAPAAKAPKQSKAQKTSPAAVVVAGEDVSIPLNLLFIDEDNARKTRTPEGITELAALIAAEGLMQRLSVVKRGDRYGVVAGGRRYTALMVNVERGMLAADAPIECKLYDDSRAVALSLTENSGREQMHPADQMEAFARLVADGLTVAQVAGRFGVTPLTVEKRLKLARISPRFLMMYREDKIDQEQLMALALVDDHATQEAAWDSLPSYDRSAYMLRNALTEREIESDDRLAVFVGLAAYKAAGGAVRRDLFAEKGDGLYLQDAQLLRTLAIEKLNVVASVYKAQGWSWVEVTLEADESGFRSHGRERREFREPTPEEAKNMAALRAAYEQAEAAAEAFEESSAGDEANYYDESNRLADACRAAERALEEAEEALAHWSPEQLARAGALVKLGYNGTATVQCGLVRPEDRKAAVAAMVKAGQDVPHDMKKGERAEFSERLMKDMTAHRTAALQAAMVDNPKVALVALVHTLAVSLFYPYGVSSPLKVSIREMSQRALGDAASEFGESQAGATLDRAESEWGDRLPGEGKALFGWLMQQDQSILLDLLAYCSARSIDVLTGTARTARDQSDELADALGVDMADWWTPTPAKYLNGVSKAKMIEAVTQAVGADAAKDVGGMKKAEAMAFCAAKLEDTRWLPAPLKGFALKNGEKAAD